MDSAGPQRLRKNSATGPRKKKRIPGSSSWGERRLNWGWRSGVNSPLNGILGGKVWGGGKKEKKKKNPSKKKRRRGKGELLLYREDANLVTLVAGGVSMKGTGANCYRKTETDKLGALSETKKGGHRGW